MKHIKNNLVVSCQALEDEPLNSSFIMSRMALAAKQAGAKGIRANGVVDIQAIRDMVDLPIIGIIKAVYPNSDVYITPTLKEARSVCETGVEVLAMDATLRQRPKESLETIVKVIKEEYPNVKLMADIATIDEAIRAEKIGFHFVGTTLHGYTQDTEGKDIAEDDFRFLRSVLESVNIPVIAEGKVDSPEKAKRVLELGAYSVVVGGAITRPQEIAKKFVDKIRED